MVNTPAYYKLLKMIEADHDVSIQPETQAQQALSIPRLHPVYLPFRTQHKILVQVQSLLEECCLDFGSIWVPDLMEARNWHEAESIELTEWTKRFPKYASSLPASALSKIIGKSTKEILHDTSILRHSAVHRLPTSAAGISNMLDAAVVFTEVFKDSNRAEKISAIRTRLDSEMNEIVQHQHLLECKLTDQLADIARRRAELDALERSSIEEMLEADKKQRAEVGSAFENFLIGPPQVPIPCRCTEALAIDELNVESEAEDENDGGELGMLGKLLLSTPCPFLLLY